MTAPEAGAVCEVPNIGRRGRRRRAAGGVVWLAAGGALAAYLARRGAAPLAYLLLAVPFTLAALGVLQARAKTCVFLAARGRRALEGEALPDAARGRDESWLVARARRQAWRVAAQSVDAGVALALAAALLAALAR